MIENRKAIAPIPAVGAAGEQSHGSKTKNIITEKSRTDNLNTGNLKTLSMTELYDTTYPPKAAIIDGLLGAISAVLKLIFKLFSTILGWIIWLVSQVLTLFPFLPPGLGALLIGGVVVCFIIGLIKFIRG